MHSKTLGFGLAACSAGLVLAGYFLSIRPPRGRATPPPTQTIAKPQAQATITRSEIETDAAAAAAREQRSAEAQERMKKVLDRVEAFKKDGTKVLLRERHAETQAEDEQFLRSLGLSSGDSKIAADILHQKDMATAEALQRMLQKVTRNVDSAEMRELDATLTSFVGQDNAQALKHWRQAQPSRIVARQYRVHLETQFLTLDPAQEAAVAVALHEERPPSNPHPFSLNSPLVAPDLKTAYVQRVLRRSTPHLAAAQQRELRAFLESEIAKSARLQAAMEKFRASQPPRSQ